MSTKRLTRREFLRTATLTSVGVVAAACVPSPAPTVAPTAGPTTPTSPTKLPATLPSALGKKPSGTLTVGIGDLGARVGLPQNGDTYGMALLSNVQEFLIYVDQDGKMIPGLAESWDMSKDGLALTFHLRKGVQFHGGYGEMTSKDVKFTSDLMMEKGARNLVAAWFQSYVKNVETPDNYTVVLNMKQASFDGFVRMSNQTPYFSIACKDYVDKVGIKAANDNWIGTGPWQLTEYVAANYAKFKAVENHWRFTPDFETLIVKAVPDAATRVMMLKAGDIDATDVTLQAVPELEKAGLKVITTTGVPFWIEFGGMYLPTRETFRKDLPWAADPADKAAWERAKKVRLAMAMAIDKQAILDTILHGRGKPIAVPGMVPTHPGYDPKWKPYAYDPDGAKKLLAEAGYPNGFSTPMYLFSLPGRDELVDVGIAVADMWGKIGIKVDTQRQDYTAVFSPAMVSRKVYGPYPYGYTYPMEALSEWDQNGRSTVQKDWFGEHADLDKMISDAVGKLNFDERAKATHDIGQWMIDNVWGIAISTKDTTYAINPKKVKNWQLVPQENVAIQLEYITKADQR